jgi:hypothetical protein
MDLDLIAPKMPADRPDTTRWMPEEEEDIDSGSGLQTPRMAMEAMNVALLTSAPPTTIYVMGRFLTHGSALWIGNTNSPTQSKR